MARKINGSGLRTLAFNPLEQLRISCLYKLPISLKTIAKLTLSRFL